MQTINTWPEFNLPKKVKRALINHLTEPFQTKAEAKVFWLESGTKLFISAVPKDAIPEYTEALPEGYTISLVITSDAGEGTYYVLPPVQEV